jgi:lysophospholipase
MVGAGVLQAFDDRTANSTKTGHLGGLLQSATYLAGLSGGSWLVGSIYINNFTTVTGLRDSTDSSVWEFGQSVLEGPDDGGLQIFDTASYYTTLIKEVDDKGDAGFKTTITDLWGRALSFQLINAKNGGPAYTWSSIALAENFRKGETPFPIIVADERAPGEVLISSNTTNYEFNPFEMGSFDPTVFGFVPTKFLGSKFSAGSLHSNDECVVGFDNAGYILGTSSSLFNQILTNLKSTNLPTLFKDLVRKLLTDLGDENNDIAEYSPNPFYKWNLPTNPNAHSSTLTLVDGGEDGQNIPLNPLIQPYRDVDVIFAIDASADTTHHWPNGTSLVATYERSLPGTRLSNGTGFPSIPDQNTFVNLGLNTRPTFFGCDASNITEAHTVPLIVYLPNSPYTYNSNISTFQLSTNDTQRDEIILNGYNVATMGNSTIGSDWAMCAGCAILKRSFGRTGTSVPHACAKCYDKYCWDGTLNSTNPANYDPALSIGRVKVMSAAPSLVNSPSMLAVVVTFAVGVALLP